MYVKNKKREIANIYRLNGFDNMELLSANYVDQKFPVHYHDTYCIGILEEGAQILSFSADDLIVPSNSVILINPNEVHCNYALDENGWKYKMMYVNPDVMAYISSLYGKAITGSIRFEDHVLQDHFTFHLISSFFNLHEKNPHQSLEKELGKVLFHLTSNYAINTEKPEHVYQDVVNNLKDFLDEKFDSKISLDAVAGTLGVSKFKMIRLFKKATGMTPFSYVLQKRIEKAKMLIAQNAKLSQVALESGFYDQSHFSKYFKSYVGVSPASYLHSCNILQDFNKK